MVSLCSRRLLLLLLDREDDVSNHGFFGIRSSEVSGTVQASNLGTPFPVREGQ